jgi:hypothetical protein
MLDILRFIIGQLLLDILTGAGPPLLEMGIDLRTRGRVCRKLTVGKLRLYHIDKMQEVISLRYLGNLLLLIDRCLLPLYLTPN